MGQVSNGRGSEQAEEWSKQTSTLLQYNLTVHLVLNTTLGDKKHKISHIQTCSNTANVGHCMFPPQNGKNKMPLSAETQAIIDISVKIQTWFTMFPPRVVL